MTLEEKKQALIQYLKVQVDLNNWKQVRKIAKELKNLETKTEIKAEALKKPQPISDILPKEAPIPHQVQEVLNLLRMNDEDLVDKLFPLPQTEAPHAVEA